MPLRKESARTGPLRLIDVEDFDLSACGGTHVARTGAIGIIAIGGCGEVSWRLARRVPVRRPRARAIPPVARCVGGDTTSPLGGARGDGRGGRADAGGCKAQQRTVRGMQEKLATHEAQALMAKGTRAGDRLVIVEALDGWDAQGLKAMAVAAAAIDPSTAVALFTTTTPALVVIAKGPNGGIDAGAVLKELVAKFGGKGGGKPDLAQGGGLSGTSLELIASARALLS